eukprot:COSAG06_NODE_4601_length_4109_cov_1.729993_3_plen_74_part_00
MTRPSPMLRIIGAACLFASSHGESQPRAQCPRLCPLQDVLGRHTGSPSLSFVKAHARFPLRMRARAHTALMPP